MTSPMLSLRIGNTMTSMSLASDPADRGTQIMPVLADLGGQPGVLGYARWTVRSPNSGAKTFVNEDPAGGAGAIGFDDQFENWYVYIEASGESLKITGTVADTQTFTLASWSSAMVDGAKVQLRLTAPGVQYAAYTYRSSSASVLPPPPGIPIQDAEVTNIASDVVTIRDGWLSSGVPIVADGQHVNRLVRLSELVATDTVTDFVIDFTSGVAAYVYSLADVSAYQVGDWMRRVQDNGATYYGDINQLLTPAFPSAMTIVAVDSGANTLTVVSRDGGTSLHRAIGDATYIDPADNGVRIYRPNATLRTVTASSASPQTLTLDDASGVSLGTGPGAVEILIGSASSSGLVPWYLEHPVYAQPTFPGIGVKFRTIDRSNWLGVANLVPNAVAKTWTTPTALPDGYLGAANLGDVGSSTPANFLIARNTDAVFTRHGQSIFVSVANGVLYFPPIPWTPMYAGQQVSTRVSLFLTRWSQNAALITLQLGIMQADGTVIPWYDQPRSVLIQPAQSTSPRPDPPFRKFAANVFDDLVLAAFDITEPSTYPVTNRPNSGDIGNMGAGLGLVACLTFNAGGGSERIEGFIDGITMVTAPDAPASVDEFHEANKAHQATNAALDEYAPPQLTIAGDYTELSALDVPGAVLAKRGNLALVNSQQLGVVNLVRRLTRVTTNHKKPADVQIELAPKRRRFTDTLSSAGNSSVSSGGVPSGGSQGASAVPCCSSSGGSTGGNTPGTGDTGGALGYQPGKLLTGNAPWWMSLSGTAGELQDVDQFDAVTQYSGGGGPQTVAVAGGRRVWVERATTGFNSNGWNLSDGNFSASADDRYLRATFWFDLNGRTVDRPVPLIQTAPTMVALGLTTDRKIELWIDDNAGGMTRLGTSTIAIPASGDRCYELRAQASVFGSTNDGFVWLRQNGVLVPFVPEGGGDPVLVFQDLELTGGSAPDNGLTLIVEWGTGGGFDFSAANGVWSGNDVYANEGGLQGVQWGERTLWRPVMGEGMFDYIAGPTGIRGAFAAVTAFGLATDDASDDDSLASGDTRSYALRPVDPVVTDILAVAPVAYLRQSNSVALITTLAITSSGDAATVTMETPGNDFRSKHSVIFAGGAPLFGVANDPHTSAQWTRDAVNAATIDLTGTQVDPFYLVEGNFDPSVWIGIAADTPSATMVLSQIGLIVVYRPPA